MKISKSKKKEYQAKNRSPSNNREGKVFFHKKVFFERQKQEKMSKMIECDQCGKGALKSMSWSQWNAYFCSKACLSVRRKLELFKLEQIEKEKLSKPQHIHTSLSSGGGGCC